MTTIIGIDCATEEANVGLAMASHDSGRGRLLNARTGSPGMLETLTNWIHAGPRPVLLALDAPLGWPRQLGLVLSEHRAGLPLSGDPDTLFSRRTDLEVRKRLGKRPLEVGADRIARTAHSALKLLQDLRTHTGQDIGLAWEQDSLQGTSVIEVYPAATLMSHGLDPKKYRGYKSAKEEQSRGGRRYVMEHITRLQGVREYRELLLSDANVLDAIICVLAAIDFLEGRAVPPRNLGLAQEEGWIWTRDLGAGSAVFRRRHAIP